LLVDEGTLSEGADKLKEALGDEPFIEVNPVDAERLHIEDGARVRVATEQGSAELPARVTADIAPGAAFVPWNQPGFAANALLNGRRHAAATLEAVGAEVSA
jgi:ferredoxin-nitrate reductase